MANFPSSKDNLTGSETLFAADLDGIINALEDKIGLGSSTPSASKVFTTNGSSESEWTKSAPTGDFVGTSDSQTLTNKTINSATVNDPTINGSISGSGVLDEDDMSSDSSTKLATQQSIKAYIDNLVGSGGFIKYTAVTPTHSNGSQADDPTYEITFAGVDLTSILYAGMKVKITQSTDKYFIITKVALDGSDTDVTLYGGTDYDLVDTGTTAISAFSYSMAKSPAGFPMDPTKWTIKVTDTTDRSAASTTTWTNLGSISINIDIGAWDVSYEVIGRAEATGATETPDMRVTLSTGTTTESDDEMTDSMYAKVESINIAASIEGKLSRRKHLVLATKDTYYLNAEATVAAGTIRFYNSTTATAVIKAVCTYL